MRVVPFLLLVFVLTAPFTWAQQFQAAGDQPADHSGKRLWKWSIVAVVAATALDAATSMRNSEANPVLRSANGQFGYRGILLKSAIASGTIAFEFHLTKRSRMHKPLAIFNFVQAGVFSGAAAYNSVTSR